MTTQFSFDDNLYSDLHKDARGYRPRGDHYQLTATDAEKQVLWDNLLSEMDDENARYRPSAEVDEAWKNDPIARCAALLLGAGVSQDELSAHATDATAEMEAVYEDAKAAAWPAIDLAYADVQDIGDPREEANRW